MANQRVKIQSFKGRLRLCWSFEGKRYWLYLGLPDTDPSRLLAEQKRIQVELDLLSGNFDQTLIKYDERKQNRLESITLEEAYTEFLDTLKVAATTKANYISVRTTIIDPIARTLVKDLVVKSLESILVIHSARLKSSTWQTYYTILKQFIKFCCKQHYCGDIWPQDYKAPTVSDIFIDPFSEEEVTAILEVAWETEPLYAPLIEFLFATGVRSGEAFGLLWQHISADGVCWIGHSLNRKFELTTTKTKKARTFKLPPKIKALLEPKRAGINEFVFLTPEGEPFSTDKLRFAWGRILRRANVRYRKQYNTRHTFISHALSKGLDPLLVAKLAGNSAEVIYNHYAGYIKSRAELPELF